MDEKFIKRNLFKHGRHFVTVGKVAMATLTLVLKFTVKIKVYFVTHVINDKINEV